jgi:di/tricarboxylate transporter
MLPMGIALTKTDAAGLLANYVVAFLGGYGGLALLGGLFIATVLLSQAVNGAVVATVIGPVAIQVAQQTNLNPRAMAMGVALATSMTFMTPLGHPVNVLVMSPGGYNFRDFLRVGLPLTILLFLVVMIFLPLFWSF